VQAVPLMVKVRPVTGSLPRYIDHRYIALMGDALREPTFLILAALAPQPLHGYAIIGEVAALSGGRLELRPGTLYGALDRLAAEGLLEPDREEVIEGRLRRYYRLTDTGASVLEQDAARLQHNADAARQRLAQRARPLSLATSQPGE
jgi:DNA-binding PadR family transcriptional regulator